MDFYQVLEKRRTIRDFSNKEVTDEVLVKVLSAAFKAPTNDHLRQFEFIERMFRVEETTALFPFPWENDSIMCCPLFARFVQQRERKQ